MRNKKETVPFIHHYSGTYAYYIRVRRRKALRVLCRVLAYFLVFVLGYFLMEMLLQASMLPPA